MDSEGKAINHYLHVETKYMPAAGFYNDSGNTQIRSQAVSIIATNSPIVDSDAFIAYLAMNYFDRYFSTNQFQDVQDVKSDSEKVRLIALCCLFISAKMRVETFSIDRFRSVKYVSFTRERITEMETNILKVLGWRMRPVTPFVYLKYYHRLFKSLGSFKRSWINEIIIQAQGENEFVCYKPSQIAMSAFLVAAKIAYPSEYNKHHYQEAEGDLSDCVRALGDLCDRKNIKIELPHDELIKILTDEIGNKTHLEEGLVEAKKLTHEEVIKILTDEIGEGWMPRNRRAGIVRDVKKPSHAEIIAILTDEIGNKTDPEEGSLERKQKAISNKIVEIDEDEERRLAKGKMVAVSKICNKKDLEEGSSERKHKAIPNAVLEIYGDLLRQAKGKAVVTSNEENRRLAKGKMVAVSEIGNKTDPKEGSLEWKQKVISNEIVEIEEKEERRLAKGKMVAEASDEERRRLAKGKMVAEASDEEKRRLAKGKMVAEASDEEKQRLAKGKMVAVSENIDEERQREPPKLISEEEKEKLEKEEQEKKDRLEAAIKRAMEKGNLEKGAEIINEPEKSINIELKWPTYVPS